MKMNSVFTIAPYPSNALELMVDATKFRMTMEEALKRRVNYASPTKLELPEHIEMDEYVHPFQLKQHNDYLQFLHAEECEHQFQEFLEVLVQAQIGAIAPLQYFYRDWGRIEMDAELPMPPYKYEWDFTINISSQEIQKAEMYIKRLQRRKL